jgi:hypothetical protein
MSTEFFDTTPLCRECGARAASGWTVSYTVTVYERTLHSDPRGRPTIGIYCDQHRPDDPDARHYDGPGDLLGPIQAIPQEEHER